MDVSARPESTQLCAVILAAGNSRRMGRCKALLPWNAHPLIVSHVRRMRAITTHIRVVMGEEAPALRAVIPEVDCVLNPQAGETEMIDSVRMALSGWPGKGLVMPVDIPPPDTDLLRSLAQATQTTTPTHQGQRGHPVLLSAASIAELTHAVTLRDVVAGAARIEASARCLCDFDTPEDFRLARAAFEGVGG